MIRGICEMKLNHATMCEAAQEWLDRRVHTPGTVVTDVRYNHTEGLFEIRLEEKPSLRELTEKAEKGRAKS